MNIIFFIHGMNQQHETAQSIEKRWLSLLEQALNQTPQQVAFTYLKRHFRMPFYGDLLSRYHLSNVLVPAHFCLKPGHIFPFYISIRMDKRN